MEFLPTVVQAEYRGTYRLRLTFNDGVENTVDFSCYRSPKTGAIWTLWSAQ